MIKIISDEYNYYQLIFLPIKSRSFPVLGLFCRVGVGRAGACYVHMAASKLLQTHIKCLILTKMGINWYQSVQKSNSKDKDQLLPLMSFNTGLKLCNELILWIKDWIHYILSCIQTHIIYIYRFGHLYNFHVYWFYLSKSTLCRSCWHDNVKLQTEVKIHTSVMPMIVCNKKR